MNFVILVELVCSDLVCLFVYIDLVTVAILKISFCFGVVIVTCD